MFCSDCGKEVLDTAKFCASCGNQIDEKLAESKTIRTKPETLSHELKVREKEWLDETVSFGTFTGTRGEAHKIFGNEKLYREDYIIEEGNVIGKEYNFGDAVIGDIVGNRQIGPLVETSKEAIERFRTNTLQKIKANRASTTKEKWIYRDERGTETWPDLGAKYEGELKDGKEDGRGTETWTDGKKYEGEWKDGMKNGRGTETWPDLGAKYEGEWKDGMKDGRGTETWTDGEKYEGEWKDGMKNGRGTETWPDGSKYEGEWKDGEKHGKGIYTYADGGKYEGEWKDGEMGVWRGVGTYTYPDGSKYEGEWKDGMKDGRGTETWPDGEKYEGEWKDGMKDGIGIISKPDGTKYEGEFKDGKLVRGNRTYPDGKTIGVIDGQLIQCAKCEDVISYEQYLEKCPHCGLSEPHKGKRRGWKKALTLTFSAIFEAIFVIFGLKFWRRPTDDFNREEQIRYKTSPLSNIFWWIVWMSFIVLIIYGLIWIDLPWPNIYRR